MQIRAMASGAEYQQRFVRFLRINGNPLQSSGITACAQMLDSAESNEITVSLNPAGSIKWWLDQINADGTSTPVTSGTEGTTTAGRILRFQIASGSMTSGEDYLLRVVTPAADDSTSAAEMELSAS